MGREKAGYIWAGLAAIILIGIILFFSIYSSKERSLEDSINRISLTADNFAYVDSSYLNGNGADLTFCEKRRNNQACGIKAEGYTLDMPCPETDVFSLYIKPINLEFPEITNIDCKIFDGPEVVKVKETDYDGKVKYRKIQHLGVPEDTGIGHIGLFLDYMKPHNLMACCIINDTRIADAKTTVIDKNGKQTTVKAGETYGTLSNEVCLQKITVNPVC